MGPQFPPATPYPEDVVTLELRAEPLPTAAKLRVLLLDDREDFRDVLRGHLADQSFQVTTVNSGVEGLREYMKAPADVILCDMMMPQMGGEMFYWAVTRVRPAARRRFIFFTGHKNNPAIDHFFQRIKATVLFKPFKLTDLDLAIRHILGN